MFSELIERKWYRTSLPWFVLAAFLGSVANVPRENIRLRYWYPASNPTTADTSRRALTRFDEKVFLGGWMEPERLGQTFGWPITVPLESQHHGLSSIHSGILIANAFAVFSLGVCAAILGAFAQALQQRARVAISNGAVSRLTLFCTAAACAIAVVASLAVVPIKSSIAKDQLRRELNEFGAVAMAIRIPEVIAQAIPRFLLSPLLKIDSVHLHSPDHRLLDQVLDKDSLRSIGLSAHQIDLATWRKLTKSADLNSLTLIDCDFSSEVEEFQAESASLRSLALHACKHVERIWRSLNEMSALTSLEITESPLHSVSELTGALPDGIKHLSTSLESPNGMNVSLMGFSQLESLTLQRSESNVRADPICLELRDLPRLTTVRVPTATAINLTIDSLPRLHSILASRKRNGYGRTMTHMRPLSIVNLRVNNSPSLAELHLEPSKLNSLCLSGTPNLRTLSMAAPEQQTGIMESTDEPMRQPLDVDSIERWINDIASCDGPSHLSFRGVRLTGIDLSPLRRNTRIRELDFGNTKVSAEQIFSIKGGDHIESLDLSNCEIDANDLHSILSAFPKLKSLKLDTSRLNSIDIINRQELQELLASTEIYAKRVVIAGSPNFSGHLMLGRDVERLHLSNVPRLKTLSVLGRLPSDTVLDGLRDLEVVELGGENVTDRVLSSLVNCRSLRELTLAAPQASASILKSIGGFSDLRKLRLPCSSVDDDVVARWHGLKHLRDIDLSHTSVSEKSLDILLSNEGLQKLALNHTALKARDLDRIVELKSLFELDVAGAGLTTATLRHLLMAKSVERLDLSGSVVSEEMVDLLASSHADHLLFVGLRRCGLDENSLRRITNSNPQLAMDIVGNDVSDLFVRELNQLGRFISRDNRYAFEQWVAGSPVQTFYDDAFHLAGSFHPINRFSRDWLFDNAFGFRPNKPRKAILRNFIETRRAI